MRVLQLYNNYQSGGGGETRVVELIEQVLSAAHHEVKTLSRNSRSIHGTRQKLGLVLTAAYSPSAKQDVKGELMRWRPDIVHVHNLYPLFSPSVLSACTELGIPVVMSVHNYGLSCPVATHFHEGQICVRCLGGHEYHCVLGNCKSDMTKSASYALRSSVARTTGLFTKHVTLFLAVSHFVRQQMIEAGYRAEQIEVVENAVPVPEWTSEPSQGDYVAYLGSMQVEKGVDTLLAAARQLPQCRFLLVGHGPDRARFEAEASPNCTFLDRQDRSAIERIYRGARLTVVPSLWWEPFGLVAVEAMSYGLPVVASRSGALPELVQDGVSGFTFDPGDAANLTRSISELWEDAAKAKAMGRAGYENVRRKYDVANFAEKLIQAYEVAQDMRCSTAHQD